MPLNKSSKTVIESQDGLLKENFEVDFTKKSWLLLFSSNPFQMNSIMHKMSMQNVVKQSEAI